MGAGSPDLEGRREGTGSPTGHQGGGGIGAGRLGRGGAGGGGGGAVSAGSDTDTTQGQGRCAGRTAGRGQQGRDLMRGYRARPSSGGVAQGEGMKSGALSAPGESRTDRGWSACSGIRHLRPVRPAGHSQWSPPLRSVKVTGQIRPK